MWKYLVFWGIALVLGNAEANAAISNVADQQRQILFEAMLYDGGSGPSLQDKKPVESAAPEAVSQATPTTPAPAARPAPQVSFQDHGQQPNAPVTPVATQPVAAPTVTPALPPGPLTKRQVQVAPPVSPTQPAQAVAAVPPVVQAAPIVAPPPRPVVAPTVSSSPQNELYRRAMSGDAEAEYQMGMLNAQDRVGMPSTAGQSHYWFTQAASKGHVKAQYNLGVMYAQGDGVVQNLIEAYIWFNLASAQRMDGAGQARDMVATSLTPDALMKAQERSSFYQQKIAQNVVRIQNEGPQAFVPIQ